MNFGKRPPPLSEEERAALEQCPVCRGVGAVRGRGQRKVCPVCKGSGKRQEMAPSPASQPVPQPA